MKMTLDEAIQHCEDIVACDSCREEHLQLAEWLKELKELRKTKMAEWINYNYKDMGDNTSMWSYEECSLCHGTFIEKTPYCPKCGAKMEV